MELYELLEKIVPTFERQLSQATADYRRSDKTSKGRRQIGAPLQLDVDCARALHEISLMAAYNCSTAASFVMSREAPARFMAS